MKKTMIYSPDNLPICASPFTSRTKMESYFSQWIKRFEHQGYYSTAKREQIPLDQLRERCKEVTL